MYGNKVWESPFLAVPSLSPDSLKEIGREIQNSKFLRGGGPEILPKEL